MENKEFLNEEDYQNSKKKVIRISMIILIVGVLIGGGLIFKGITVKNDLDNKREKQELINREDSKKKQEEAKQKEEDKSARIEELNKLIDETQKKIDNTEVELTKLLSERTKIFEQDRGFSDRYNAKDVEITKKQNEKSNLQTKLHEYKSELSKLNSTSYISDFEDTFKSITSNIDDTFNKQEYIPYFMIGGFIIFTSCIMSGFVYMIAKRREIMAFTAQQTIPVAKESMEKMSESVSKVSGDMAREISKGIEEGKAQAKVPHVVRCPHCGADNEIIGKTGKCEFCQSKISYKE